MTFACLSNSNPKQAKTKKKSTTCTPHIPLNHHKNLITESCHLPTSIPPA